MSRPTSEPRWQGSHHATAAKGPVHTVTLTTSVPQIFTKLARKGATLLLSVRRQEMRRYVCAIVVFLLLSTWALGRGHYGRRSGVPSAHLRVLNVQAVPDFVRRGVHLRWNDLSNAVSSVPGNDAPGVTSWARAATPPEPLPSDTPALSAPAQQKLLDSAADVLRCGQSPSTGCFPSEQNLASHRAH
jgi:hypothetical protein